MEKKENNKFKCCYPNCGYEFELEVDSTGSNHNRISTQVVCPKCGNFLKTWD